MMHRLLVFVALAALFGVAGCGDDTTSAVAADLAAVGDLAVSSDLSQLSCASIVSCFNGCGQNLACRQGCIGSGTSAGKAKFALLQSCVADSCGPAADGGPHACSGTSDTSTVCQTCLDSAFASAAGVASGCHDAFSTCLAN